MLYRDMTHDTRVFLFERQNDCREVRGPEVIFIRTGKGLWSKMLTRVYRETTSLELHTFDTEIVKELSKRKLIYSPSVVKKLTL